jgi:PAS domain S-box-containing protein
MDGNIEQDAIDRAYLFSRTTALIVLVLSCLVLVGWLLQSDILKGLIPGQTVVRPMAALSIALISVSLVLLSPPHRSVPQILAGRFCALIAMFLGIAATLEYLSNTNFGIDDLFCRFANDNAGLIGIATSGRMWPMAAVNSALLGIALITIDKECKGGWHPAQLLCLAALLLSFPTLIGYAFGIFALCRPEYFAFMPLSTGLMFAALSIGTLVSRIEFGPGAILLKKSPVGFMCRRMFAMLLAYPIILGLLRYACNLLGLTRGEISTTVLCFLIAISAPYVVWRISILLSTSEDKAREQTQLSALSASVSSTLVRAGTMRELLQGCVEAIVEYLDTAFARIWTVDESGKYLILQASAGLYTHINGGHARIAIGEYKVGLIASEQKPHLTNDVQNDPRVSNREWAKQEGMTAFAGHPLMVGQKLVGVVALFSRHPLSQVTITALDSIADHIALGIERKAEEYAHSQLAGIVQTSNDAIIGNDLKGKIIYWNSAAELLYGYMDNEVIGHPSSILCPNDRLDDFDKIFERVKQGEYLQNYETVRQRKDGNLVDISLTISPIKDCGDNITGFSDIARDVTERKLAAEATKQLLLLQEREDFMFTLTHDLKNPLIGANRILEQLVQGEFGNIPQEPADVLMQLKESNIALVALIQNIIEVYRYERDTRTVVLTELDLRELVTSCLNEFTPVANSRNIKITTKVPDRQIPVLAEANSMRRVLHNLMDNAIKFSPENASVEISLHHDNGSMILRVHNSGESIAAEDREFLFQRFWQGTQGKRYVAGSGLGLYLCHKVVASHHGTITCTSDEISGTTFTVILPVCESATE